MPTTLSNNLYSPFFRNDSLLSPSVVRHLTKMAEVISDVPAVTTPSPNDAERSQGRTTSRGLGRGRGRGTRGRGRGGTGRGGARVNVVDPSSG